MLLATSRRSPARRRSAFTLLEVLVVVAILVILATVATVATTRYIEDAKKSKAQLGCQSIATAIEAYMNSPQNPGRDLTDDQKMPSGPQDLYQPPFGGPSFLRNGAQDTLDPWGRPYQFQPHTRHDGTTYILVSTTAPDGTQVSQHGIGPNAIPKN
jgi:general secretion pathway protein G